MNYNKIYVLPEHTELMYEYVKANTIYLFQYVTFKHCTVFYANCNIDIFKRQKLNIPYMCIYDVPVSHVHITIKGYEVDKKYIFKDTILFKKSQIPYWLKTQHKRYQTYKLLKLIGQ